MARILRVRANKVEVIQKLEYRFLLTQAICFCITGTTNVEYAIAYLAMLVPFNITAYLFWKKLEGVRCIKINAVVWLSPVVLLVAALPLAVWVGYAIMRE